MADGKTGVDCGVPCIRFVCNLTICMSALVSLCIQYIHTYVYTCVFVHTVHALVSLCIQYICTNV